MYCGLNNIFLFTYLRHTVFMVVFLILPHPKQQYTIPNFVFSPAVFVSLLWFFFSSLLFFASSWKKSGHCRCKQAGESCFTCFYSDMFSKLSFLEF